LIEKLKMHRSLKNMLFFITIAAAFLSNCTPRHTPSNGFEMGVEEAVAFPGAEGFGKYTTGGRGGKIFIVTNLNDAGPGSFREAAEAKGKRIILFAVDGTIHLQSELNIRGDVTIAGQTAPGEGICLADHPVSVAGNNVIIRYLRFRMGDRFQNKGMVAGSGHDDALSATNRKNVIIDHCSMSWSTDEAFSVYNGDSVTLQWNMIAEPLNYSYHFEKGDTDFEQHGYGGIWGGRHLTAHHNLFAHCVSRNPRFAGIRSVESERVDYRNNVIYNWGTNNVYGGEGGEYNIVNNYYKFGPATKKSVQFRIVNPGKQASPFIPFGKFYVKGNFVDGSEAVTKNNHEGVHLSDGTEEDKSNALTSTPFQVTFIPTQTAEQAYESVLAHAGASFRRDTLDQRIVNDVKTRAGKFIDVQGGYPHGSSYNLTASAWPFLKAGKPGVDSDSDGMPDDWEKAKGLDPQTPNASALDHSTHYTNIEVYINGLVK
jgi:pectate lyase